MRRQAVSRKPIILAVLALVWLCGKPGGAAAPEQGAPPAATAGQAPQGPPATAASERPRIFLNPGRSTVIDTAFDVTRVLVNNPAVADVLPVKAGDVVREVVVDGKSPGTTSVIVWGDDTRVQYDVVVEAPVSGIEQQLHQLFPGEDIQVATSEGAVVLSGHASSTAVMLRVGEVVKAALGKATVINMLQVPGAAESQQVMLMVRIAEVNRRAVTELGVSFFTNAMGSGDWVGRVTTQQFPGPAFARDELVFSDFLNIFLFNTRVNVGALFKALKETGYFQSLAEPNLIAYNNKEASFLAGGEIPVPVVQGVSGAVDVEYKEFGVSLTFTPTIAGDLIRLHVKPEVSTLDFNNGVTLQGFRIPALTTRRAETEVELSDGQSFAIAGLINNQTQTDGSAIPWISDIPIIGNLFKSKADRKERTELLVIVTPRLVRALNPDEVPPLPTLPGRFLPPTDDIGEQLQGGGGAVDAPNPPQK